MPLELFLLLRDKTHVCCGKGWPSTLVESAFRGLAFISRFLHADLRFYMCKAMHLGHLLVVQYDACTVSIASRATSGFCKPLIGQVKKFRPTEVRCFSCLGRLRAEGRTERRFQGAWLVQHMFQTLDYLDSLSLLKLTDPRRAATRRSRDD